MSLLTISGPRLPQAAQIQLPYSKSVLNRSLIIKALAGDNTGNISAGLDETLLANDSRILLQALQNSRSIYDMEDAGTALRFLLAYFAVKPGHVQLTGTPRLQQRPLAPLIAALRQLGADIVCTQQEGFAPLLIQSQVKHGGPVAIDASVSSQFVSALLMIAPCLQGGLQIEQQGHIVSGDYTSMTITLMQQAGARVTQKDNRIEVAEGKYSTDLPLAIEADWSAASYWFLMAALLPAGSTVWLQNLSLQSLQGDAVVAQLCKPFGVHVQQKEGGLLLQRSEKNISTFAYDFTACPDLVPAMAVLCAATGVEATMKGVAHLRLKESDRLHALATELAKAGVHTTTEHNTFYIHRSTLQTPSAAFETHKDHRMAMSLAALGLVLPGVSISGTEVVAKSYPGFWQQLQRAGVEVR